MAAPRIRTIIVNVAEFAPVVDFWSGFLQMPAQEADAEASIVWLEAGEPGPNMGFQRVANLQASPGPIHLDVEVDDLDDAQQKIESLGGTIAKVNKLASGFEWRVANDPVGNEFCIFAH